LEEPGKVWTLGEARSELPEIRIITEDFRRRFEEIEARIETGMSKAETTELENQLSDVFIEWSRGMIEKGIHVKGPWLCDFDSGDGYFYCWKYPEEEISYFHLYEAGFEGRRPISFLKSTN